MADPSKPERIEVGATPETGLRLWRSREAMRQAEARLTFQASALATFETRAQALVGWAVAGATALLGGLLIVEVSAYLRAAGGCALVALLASVWFGLQALRPGNWIFGGDVNALLDSPYQSELQEHEATARGMANGIEENDCRLDKAASKLGIALACFGAAPLAAALGAGACYLLLTYGPTFWPTLFG